MQQCNFILVDPEEAKPQARPRPVINNARAAKFRDLADAMQSAIDNKLGDRQTNTPKRMQQASYARLDGEHLQRTQEALRKLADLPAMLPHLTTKKAVHDLTKSELNRGTGYYSPSTCTGKPYRHTPEALTVWALLAGKSDDDVRADKLREMVNNLAFANIPGYFATPESLVSQMFAYADVQPGHRFLEPEAGSGAIADKAAGLGASVDCCEVWHSLREILQAKEHNLIASDFMDLEVLPQYDRIVMNPPFEKLQDIDHVRKAYQHLKDGGVLVSIMSPGPFYRADRKSREFREWLDQVGSYKTDVPAGEFKQSGTNISTVIVVIEK
ncbi:MAG: class I SAM-dependent methyltransferase [Nitrospinaceae bacterium]